MKRNVLRIFSLILLALVVCTILSVKIQDEMTLEAIGWVVKADYYDNDIPASMLFNDENGQHAYEIYEGTGWESGLRAREVPLNSGYFFADRDYTIVRGASRQPVYGELAKLYDGTETAPSTYLAVYPGGIPEENAQLFQAKILEQSEHVLLLYVENGVQPFTENRAKNGLIQLSSGNWHIYSMDALTQLLENIPAAVAALIVVTTLAVFGLYSFFLAGNPKRNRWLLILNCLLLFCLLGGLILLLNRIDFPSSMLPPENIFRISHYRSLCREIFQALEELSGPTTRAFQALRTQVLTKSMLTVLLSSAAILFLILLETLLSGAISRKRRYKAAN